MTSAAEREAVPLAVAPSGDERLLPRDVPLVFYVDTSWESGGVPLYTTVLIEEIVRLGYAPALICPPGEVMAPMRARLLAAGAALHVVAAGGRSPAARLKRFLALRRAVRRYRGGVLIALMGFYTLGNFVTMAAAGAGLRAFIRADLQSPVPPFTWWYRRGMLVRDHFCDGVIVGSLENIEAFRRIGRGTRKLRVVHTGVEVERFGPRNGRDEIRCELGYAGADLVVGTISRLSEERKGIGTFVEMAALAARRLPEARFLIAGDGRMRAHYERMAQDLGLGGRLRFLGWRDDVPRILAGLDLFVMPSHQEGGPSSVIEAMATGLPVVATAVGMVPEIIEDGASGFVVNPGDSATMAARVEVLLRQRELRRAFGERARVKARNELSVRDMARGYLAVAGSLLRPR